MFKLIASLLAGYGLLLVGLKEFTRLLNESSSSKFSFIVKTLTKNPFTCFLAGIVIGIVTVGNIVLSVCLVGAAHSMKLINQNKLLLLMNFSRIGSCLYVFLAGFDLSLVILLAIGISGICWGLKKPQAWQGWAPLLFQLGVVLFGVQLIKTSADLLDNNPLVYQAIAYTQVYPVLAFIAGFLLMLISQSFFAAMVIGISFVGSEVFTLEEALLCLAGIYCALGASRYFYLFAFEKSLKKAMSLIPYYYFLCTGLTLLYYFVNYRLLSTPYFDDASKPQAMIALYNFCFHITSSFTLLPFHSYFITKSPSSLSKELHDKSLLKPLPSFSSQYFSQKIEMEYQTLCSIISAFRCMREGRDKAPTFRRLASKNRKSLASLKEDLESQKTDFIKQEHQQNLLVFADRLLILESINKALEKFCQLSYELLPTLKHKSAHHTLLRMGLALEVLMQVSLKALQKPTHFNQQILKKVTEPRVEYFQQLEKKIHSLVDRQGFFYYLQVLQQYQYLLYLLSQLRLSLKSKL